MRGGEESCFAIDLLCTVNFVNGRWSHLATIFLVGNS